MGNKNCNPNNLRRVSNFFIILTHNINQEASSSKLPNSNAFELKKNLDIVQYLNNHDDKSIYTLLSFTI